MPRKKASKKPKIKMTPGAKSGGFLFDLILLPPLAVILVGIVMACVLSQVTLASTFFNVGDGKGIAPLFTPEVQYWEHKIVAWSEEWSLDPNLVATVMQIESCGNPRARSGAGAMGLFQVMPYHFVENEDPYKPNTNAYRGLSYLRNALDARGGDSRLAFAGYNGGIAGARRPEYAWPAETVRYAYWGIGIYSDARLGKDSSSRLNEWLAAGGASLCANAAWHLGIRE